MVVIAIANGVFSQFVLSRFMSDYGAHLYRVGFAIAVISIFAYFFVKRFSGTDLPWYAPAFGGLQWVVSSLVFEFIFGHYVFGMPWEKIVSEYRIYEGRLWSLVIASEFIAPFVHSFLFNRA